MTLTLHIADELADHLAHTEAEVSREALEALAVHGYRTDRLSEEEVRVMLGFDTRMQVHDLLKRHDVAFLYDVAEFHKDLETARQMGELRS